MRDSKASEDVSLLQALNDLLRLDRDAEEAYRVAIAATVEERHRLLLAGCREDHRRHAADLSRLIRRLGGRPVGPSHFRPGAFTWGVRAVAGLGGDRELLSVLHANEEQARDSYRRRAGEAWPAEAAELLRRHAEDEARHFSLVEGLLRAAQIEESAAHWPDRGGRDARRAIA